MSWNHIPYECRCGKCVECIGRMRAKSIYNAPTVVREAFFQKKASDEEALMARGYMKIPCPQCHRDRLVEGRSLKHGFSCDKCGYRTPSKEVQG